jgi:hypothetical protein
MVLAENVIKGGTKLIITSGSKLVSTETLLIKDGATLNNSGTIIFKKNLSNETPGQNSIGSGIAEFSGTVNQTITGINQIQDIRINNPAGVTLGGQTLINGQLILDVGMVTLDIYDLMLGPLATIAGSPSALSMVIATPNGMLKKGFPTGYTGSFTFPVGDNTSTAEYSPVTLDFNVATTDVNDIGIAVVNDKFPDPAVNGNFLNRYWLVNCYCTNLNCTASFQYAPADVVGDESVLSCSRVGETTWTTYGLTNPVSHTLSAIGFTTGGFYTGVKSNTPPLDQQVKNVTLGNGTSNCYDAIHSLTIAGGGSTFLVKNGGSVTLVAGQRVTMLSGTTVKPGGYLHAFISANGSYCGAVPSMLATTSGEAETTGAEAFTKSSWIKIYPNPTADKVIVELVQTEQTEGASISIYNMQGARLLEKSFGHGTRFEFSLAEKPVGCYLFHVQSDGKSELAKVIKQ